MIKTYAIKGLMEFQALIPAGRSRIRIPFTGGALSGYGVTPATFRTSDPSLQHLIEASPDFRRGRLFLLRSEPDQPSPDPGTQGPASHLLGPGFSRGGRPERPSPGPGRQGEAVIFTDLSEAREYLAEKCGIDRRQLRSTAAIREAAAQCGVTINTSDQ